MISELLFIIVMFLSIYSCATGTREGALAHRIGHDLSSVKRSFTEGLEDGKSAPPIEIGSVSRHGE